MPVIVGLVLSVIFLIVFSEWFYYTFVGWKEIVLDDKLYRIRIAGATLFSFLVFFASFIGMAYATKCPDEERTGIFERLNCEEYQKLKLGTELFFQPSK